MSWQRMSREQLVAAVRKVGEQRGNRKALPVSETALDSVASKVAREVINRVDALVGETDAYNVRIKTLNGRTSIDVHGAGEPAGQPERTRYNALRSAGRDHHEAIEQMISGMKLPADHVRPAVGAGHYSRITVPLAPGGRVYARREDLGRADNPNAAQPAEELAETAA